MAIVAAAASTRAVAQTAEPSYKGDPDVYRVIFEDANFRVIEAIRKVGVRDKLHGHPLPSVVYTLTDCKTKMYGANGRTSESSMRAGHANAVPIVAAHSAENVGSTDCRQLFVEKK
ncbi:MAG TPA: hypothetical protein VGG01_25100 [Xanthobacteraceae bacterium]